MSAAANRGRRRLAWLGAVAIVSGATGAAAGAVSRADPPPPRPGSAASAAPAPAPTPTATPSRSRQTAAELAGQVVIMRFAGNPAPAYVARALRADRAAGVILFTDNAVSPAATRRMTARLQRAGRGRAIVCLDQEGGAVRVMPWASPRRGQPQIATRTAARSSARAAGRDLHRYGINVALAPVADVGVPGAALAGRFFPGGAARVAPLVTATVRGYRGTGVTPTVKHFPGLGAATANTDDQPVTIRTSARTIGARDLPPFKAAIAAGAPIVMVSHARYPALDPDAIASQSRAVVTGLLKRRLRFRGVAMTDSLEAKAVGAADDPGAAAVRSVRAGIDLVLTTGPGSHLRVVRALAAQTRRDPGFRARLADAAARTRALRHSVGRSGR